VLGQVSLESRARITVLWILVGFDMSLVFSLKEFDPGSGGLQNLLNLPSQQLYLVLLGDAAIRLAPFVLAFLSLVLKDTLNRRMNLGLGFVFAIAGVYGLVPLVTQLSFPVLYDLLTQVVVIAAAVLIFWYAYRWSKDSQPLEVGKASR